VHHLPDHSLFIQGAVVSRIKIMSDLDIAERRLPQDGKIKFKKYGGKDIELRVATIPTQGGLEDVVMRLLAAGEPIPLDKMGFSKPNYKNFISVITKPYGLIFVCGPTGSGKTTTLHSALSFINKTETKIWTAEDPVEITQRGLRQVQVKPKIGFDFAAAMRAFLRADPDVIMVGEMRDKETTSIGIEASLTGHLVFSTLHTNSAPESITRLLDMGMDPFNFADAILCIWPSGLFGHSARTVKKSTVQQGKSLTSSCASTSRRPLSAINPLNFQKISYCSSRWAVKSATTQGTGVAWAYTSCSAVLIR
jgi:type II secretory ATPase GspE/PulE/Tfp pilus assembly ATPase PilB-like protein